MLYHRRLAPRGKVFQNADEAATALAEGWVDSPAKFPKPFELSLAELRQDFFEVDEQYRQWTSNGASLPGSQRWEEVTAARTTAKDLYDFRLRESELSPAEFKVPARGSGKIETFNTAFGTYLVRGILGEGGSGVVYDVHDDDGGQWAIKCLRPTALNRQKLKRFKNEIGLCSKLKHPNIVGVEDWGLVQVGEAHLPFFVMRQYPTTLRKLMREGMAPSDGLFWFLQLLAGIEAAHDKAVWHRDLKPENLLCEPTTETLVVADFGIAHVAEPLLHTTIETQPQDRMANFQYAAPEQRRSEIATVDHRADIYALGLILNELFTGEVLQGTGHKKIATASPEFGYLDALVERMVRQSPNDRPASVAEIRQELVANGVLPRANAVAAACGETANAVMDSRIKPTVSVANAGSTERSGDDLFAALRQSILESADRSFPQPVFIDAFQLGQQFGLAIDHVREFMTELHRDGCVSIAKWDGKIEREYDRWRSFNEFFYHPADGSSVRVVMKRRGKQLLENVRKRHSESTS